MIVKTLQQELQDDGVFSEVKIWQVLEEILPLLHSLHQQGHIHGKICPEYISRGLSLSLIGQDAPKSPEYLAPEQLEGRIFFASDLYSLGLTCLNLLTNISPFLLFDSTEQKWIWKEYLSQPISPKLEQILEGLTEIDLKKRFTSAIEVIELLSPYKVSFPPKEIWSCLHTIKDDDLKQTLVIDAQRNLLITGSSQALIELWDLYTLEKKNIFRGHNKEITSLSLSPDGETLASASKDYTIKLWSITNQQEINTLKGHQKPVTTVAFSPNGEILASGSDDKMIKLWSLSTGAEIASQKAHNLQITALAFSPDGTFLVSTSKDRTVALWNLLKGSIELEKRAREHTWSVTKVVFSPNNLMATASEDNTVKLWQKWEVIATLSGHSWSVVALAFSRDGQILITGSWDKTIRLWQVETPEEICTLKGHQDSVLAVCVDPQGQMIISSSKDGTLKVWQKDK